jgi:(E)-4-hydroxy-3-methylbut-2-enyl-diphosphate synthase
VNAGCEIVRITAQGTREAETLANIKKELLKKGINIPLVADIHFNPKVAEVAAAIVEKVRINPGNYVGAGPGKVTLYKGKEVVLKNIAEEKAVESLISLIKEGGDWKQSNN